MTLATFMAALLGTDSWTGGAGRLDCCSVQLQQGVAFSLSLTPMFVEQFVSMDVLLHVLAIESELNEIPQVQEHVTF